MTSLLITDIIKTVFESAPWVQELFFVGLFAIMVARIQGELGMRFFLSSFISLLVVFLLSTVVSVHDPVIKFAWVMTVLSLAVLIIRRN